MKRVKPSVWLPPLLLTMFTVTACATFTSGDGQDLVIDERQVFANSTESLTIKTPDVPVNIRPSSDGQVHVHFHGSASKQGPLELITRQDDQQLLVALKPTGPVVNMEATHNLQLDVELPALQELNVRTAAGKVSLTDYQGKNLSLNTATGHVEIVNVTARTWVKTLTGPVLLKLKALQNDVNIQSESGDLSVTLPATSNFDATLESPAAKPKIEFALHDQQNKGKGILGTVGSGGPLLNLSTNQGALKVLKK